MPSPSKKPPPPPHAADRAGGRADVPSQPTGTGHLTLVVGGARSGKSRVAEELAASTGEPVTYVATAVVTADDPDLAERVTRHRARRPASWQTLEAGASLPQALVGLDGAVLVDALGTWVAATPDLRVDPAELCRVLARRKGRTVVVSEEVGLGVHPETALGRRFRDVLGELNQAVAAVADEVLLVVAGRVLRLPAPPAAGPPSAAGPSCGA